MVIPSNELAQTLGVYQASPVTACFQLTTFPTTDTSAVNSQYLLFISILPAWGIRCEVQQPDERCITGYDCHDETRNCCDEPIHEPSVAKFWNDTEQTPRTYSDIQSWVYYYEEW